MFEFKVTGCLMRIGVRGVRRCARSSTALSGCALALLLGAASTASGPATAAIQVQEVQFPSRDGRATLKAYAFMPITPGPWPAVVMLHGRSGSYSDAAKGVFDASTLSMRHRQWGQFWAERGYLALHVDSFGPRGYPQGFPVRSYAIRPPDVSEQTVRPLDAYGALDYLRSRSDVIKDRIGLQGWSNGAMAGLATLASHPPGMQDPTPTSGFRAALLLYPSCRIQLQQEYRPYAPALMFIAGEDEEVAPAPCRKLAKQTRARGATQFELVWYEGATHSFDDPGKRQQAVEANRSARADVMERADRYFHRHLRE